MLTSLYVDGGSPLHRLTARIKLLLLLVASVVLFFVTSLWILIPSFLVALCLLLMTGLGFRAALARISPVVFAIVFLSLVTAWLNSPLEALQLFFRLMAVVVLAAAITATTTITEFMDEVTILAMPLERMGLLKAADIGLAIALVIRFVPEILVRYAAIREAHQARGLPMRPMTLFAPLIIQTLKDADMIAMAIDARGFRRQ